MPTLRFPVPFSFAFIFRALVMLLLAAHVFYMYCTARGMAESFGFRPGTTIVACLFALVMLIPLVWAVAIPEIPEAFTLHILPRRRWKQGRCRRCGYDLRGIAQAPDAPIVCPECGLEASEPEAADMWQVGARTIRRFMLINALAWVIGCAAGETWMQIDEHRFRDEAQHIIATSPRASYSRARHWPNSSATLLYQHPAHFSSTD